MPDFWPSCGYRLLAAAPAGRLAVSDEFLRSYLLRPELAPMPESCAAELALHGQLLARPRSEVRAEQIVAISDADVRDNYRIWLRFRDRLVTAPTLEAAYAGLFAGEGVDAPPQFVHQLTAILLRHLLGEDADPFEARAAEMLFRPQRVSLPPESAPMAADLETVELYATTGGFGSLGELLAQNRTPTRTIDLDVLSEDNATTYWGRDERHDFALSLNRGGRALDALCRVLERWIAHMLAVEVASARGARLTTAAGCGTSGSTPRRARCSMTCTIAPRSARSAWSDCCACSNSTLPIRPTCGLRLRGGPSIWRWLSIASTG